MITRRKATRLIPHVIEAAQRQNVNPWLLHRIDCIALFGSYVNSKRNAIGDLDVAIRLKLIPGRSIDDFMLEYPRPAGHPEERAAKWPMWGAAAAIHMVSPHIHVNLWDFIEDHAVPHRVIWVDE
jgi:hypothetical protein